MKILLTGANGFLGAILAQKLVLSGHSLVKTSQIEKEGFIRCDLASVSDVDRVLISSKPDLVLHCAAIVPKTIEQYNDLSAYEPNMKMVENLTKSKCLPFVFVSSMTVYGVGDEKIYSESKECFPATAYAASKLQGEHYIENRCRDSISLRIPGLYSETRLGGLVSNVIMSILTDKKINLPSSALQWAAMHVEDAASSIVSIINKYSPSNNNQTVNIGYRDRYSINNLLRDCEVVFGGKLESPIQHPEFQFDLSKLESLRCLPPTLTLVESLESMKDYYMAHFKVGKNVN